MEIKTIYALFDKGIQPDAAICEVIAIRTTDNKLIIDEGIVNDNIGNALIYVPQFHINNEFPVLNKYEAVEISFKEKIPQVEKQYPRIHHYGVRRSSLKYAIEIEEGFIDKQHVDLEELESNLLDNQLKYLTSSFYFSTHDIVYGPFVFSLDSKTLRPEKGKEVQKSKIDLEKVIEHPYDSNIILLFESPIESLGEIDCSTNDQLIQWIKDKIKAHQDNRSVIEVLNRLRKQLIQGQFEGLDLVRYERAKSMLDNLVLNLEELEQIKRDEAWVNIFDTTFEKYKHVYLDQIKMSLQDQLDEQQARLTKVEDEIVTKEENLIQLQDSIASVEQDKQLLEEEITHLTVNRRRIVQDMKLQLELKEENKSSNRFYEVLEFQNPSNQYYSTDSDEEFIENLEDARVRKADSLGEDIKTLQSSKFILGNDINFTLTLIRSVGDAIVYLQQAEGDWLKFENWYANGLVAIIDKAISDPNKMYFYVLQDYNIASPECYAKPIIDISRGIRKSVPGTSTPWPVNLWVILIPLEIDIEDFGFEPNEEETFWNWSKLSDSKIKKLTEFLLPKKWNLL